MERSFPPKLAAESSYLHEPFTAAGSMDDRSGVDAPNALQDGRAAGPEQRLAQVVANVEEFLTHHVGRLTGVLRQCQAQIEREQELEREQNEFEGQRGDWEQQRQHEANAIAEERERIVSSWKKLEAEERRVATHAESMRLDRDAGLVVDATTGQAAAPAARPQPQPAPVAPTEQTPATVRTNGRSHTGSSHNARLQFEHLRREIQNHARRGRAK